MNATIEVLDVRRLDRDDSLKGIATARLGCITIHGIRAIQQPGADKPWIALPQTAARKKADGSGAGWYPVVEITNARVLKQLSDKILAEWAAE
jgi:hypothetical protein